MPEPLAAKNSLTMRAFWLMFAKGAAFCISFGLPIFLTRRLTQTNLGLYKGAFQFVNTSLIWLQMGIGLSAYYFIPRETQNRQGAVAVNVLLFYALTGGAACLLLLFYPQSLGYLIGGETGRELIPLAPLIGLAILAWIGSSFLEVVSVANQEAHITTLFIVNAQLTKTGFLFLAALFFGSVKALLWAAIIQGVVQASVLQWYLRSRFGAYWRSFSLGMLREQLAYALPVGFAGLLSFVIVDMHIYFVTHQYSAAEVAIYSTGCFVLPLIGIINDSVSAIMVPRVSYLQKQGDTRAIIDTSAGAMRKLAALYFPLFAYLFLLGDKIIELLFTRQYAGSYSVFVVTICLLPFLIFIADPILRAYAKHRFFMMRVRLVLVLFSLTALWQATRRFGPVGAIVVMIGVHVLDKMIVALKAWSIVGVTWRDARRLQDVGKAAGVTAAAAAATALFRARLPELRPFFIILWSGLLFSTVYGLGLLLGGFLRPEERAWITRYTAFLRPAKAETRA